MIILLQVPHSSPASEKWHSLHMTVLYKADPVNYLQGSVCQRARGIIFRHTVVKAQMWPKTLRRGWRENKETEAALRKQWKKRGDEGKKKQGEDSNALTVKDRKKETVYSRDIEWGREPAIQTHSVQKHRDVQSYLLSLNTAVGIPAALCQYMIRTRRAPQAVIICFWPQIIASWQYK